MVDSSDKLISRDEIYLSVDLCMYTLWHFSIPKDSPRGEIYKAVNIHELLECMIFGEKTLLFDWLFDINRNQKDCKRHTKKKIRLSPNIFCANVETRKLRMIESVFMFNIFYQMLAKTITTTYVLYRGLQNDHM